MLHVDQLKPNMNVVGSDGVVIGAYRSLSGQLMQIAEGALPTDRHFLDLALVADVEGDQIKLLVTGAEAKQRWSDEI